MYDCFQENSTVIKAIYGGWEKMAWYAERNAACKEFNLGKAHRDSVPLNLKKSKIRPFLKQSSSEPWKAMKLVVLGHGGIGKTTLVHKLKDHTQPVRNL